RAARRFSSRQLHLWSTRLFEFYYRNGAVCDRCRFRHHHEISTTGKRQHRSIGLRQSRDRQARNRAPGQRSIIPRARGVHTETRLTMSSSSASTSGLNDCGCCEGISAETPAPVDNRPGLAAIAYRIGTHATVYETLLARLSTSNQPALRTLTTRDPDDFSIAWLHAWATVADVLTFYQERIANEAFLRTATERLSVLELTKLIDYQL